MSLENIRDYVLWKYQPEQILLQQRTTKKLFRFFDSSKGKCISQPVYHPALQKAEQISSGLIYPKQLTTMYKELSNKRQLQKYSGEGRYQQNQLVNTFSPILECIQYLNKENIIHGGLCLETIVVNQEGQICLRDWNSHQNYQKYYLPGKKQVDDDFRALGYLILQCATLKTIQQIMEKPLLDDLLKTIIPHYSKGLILTIAVLTKRISKFYPLLSSLIENQSDRIIENSPELRDLYNKIKCEKDKKVVFTPPIPTYSQQQMEELVSKKIATTRKIHRIDDTENKKLGDDSRIKNTEKIKISDRNNLVINEAFNPVNNRKTHQALKKMSNGKGGHIQTTHLIQNANDIKKTFKDTRDFKQCKDFREYKQYRQYREELIRNQLPKRLRTVSRKKNF